MRTPIRVETFEGKKWNSELHYFWTLKPNLKPTTIGKKLYFPFSFSGEPHSLGEKYVPFKLYGFPEYEKGKITFYTQKMTVYSRSKINHWWRLRSEPKRLIM